MSEEKKQDIPWVEKYRPNSIKEMALPKAKLSGQKVDLAEQLTSFIQNFFKEIKEINEKNKEIRLFNKTASNKEQKKELRLDPEKAAVLLEGQPGIGKTSIAYALANDFNMDVVETNASDTRTRDALEAKLKETSKSRGILNFIGESKKKLILIDEVDGIYGTKDRGAVPAILDLVKDTQFPIIMCANDYKTNLQSLYNTIPRYEVHPLSKREIMKILNNILKKENIQAIKEEDLELIITKNSGDLRGIINDLQALSRLSTSETDDNQDFIISLHRDTTEEIFGLIRDLFKKVNTLSEAKKLTDKSDVDYNFLYKWVNENLPTFITKNKEIRDAYENLSYADVIFGRIRRDMYWSLLPYFYDLFAGGVTLAKQNTQSKGWRVSFPRYSSSISYSLNTTEKNLVKKLKKRYKISQFEAIRDFVPFLKELSAASRRNLKEISDYFDLNAKEKNLLKK
ncbi:MAG: replication factor C large subunit [Candidatus Lokiarchaeota archaeon]